MDYSYHVNYSPERQRLQVCRVFRKTQRFADVTSTNFGRAGTNLGRDGLRDMDYSYHVNYSPERQRLQVLPRAYLK